jgi:DNA-binding MarR family transcriptional regulator
VPASPTASPTAPKRATTDPAAMAARLRLSATRLARILRRHADTGLSPSQLAALATVDLHGPMTLGALAEHERVAPPSITKVVTKLEADGLLAREADPRDRRVAVVSLTEEGTALLAASRRRKNQWLNARLQRLDADERTRLANALDVIEKIISQDQP